MKKLEFFTYKDISRIEETALVSSLLKREFAFNDNNQIILRKDIDQFKIVTIMLFAKGSHYGQIFKRVVIFPTGKSYASFVIGNRVFTPWWTANKK